MAKCRILLLYLLLVCLEATLTKRKSGILRDLAPLSVSNGAPPHHIPLPFLVASVKVSSMPWNRVKSVFRGSVHFMQLLF